jgi:hypothetical protein
MKAAGVALVIIGILAAAVEPSSGSAEMNLTAVLRARRPSPHL